MSAYDAGGLDGIFAATRAALASVRAGGAPADGEPPQATGTAHDEQIRATVQAPGRLVALEIAPRLMRLPSEELTQEIITAVNAALDELRASALQAVNPGGLEALDGQLEELHQESIRQMERFMSAISAMADQLRARSGR